MKGSRTSCPGGGRAEWSFSINLIKAAGSTFDRSLSIIATKLCGSFSFLATSKPSISAPEVTPVGASDSSDSSGVTPVGFEDTTTAGAIPLRALETFDFIGSGRLSPIICRILAGSTLAIKSCGKLKLTCVSVFIYVCSLCMFGCVYVRMLA